MTESGGLRVAITGAGGFIGWALAGRLAARGHGVIALARRPVVGLPVTIEQRKADLEHALEPALLKDATHVVHLAVAHETAEQGIDDAALYRRINVEATGALLDLAREAGVRRFVFLSSVRVHGRRPPLPVTEATPFAPDDAYGESKLAAERLVAQAAGRGMETVILRPPVVIGPGARGNLVRLMRLVGRGLPLPFGRVHNRRSFIGRDSLLDAIEQSLQAERAAGNGPAPGNAYVLADREELSTVTLMQRIADGLGRRLTLLPVPRPVVSGALRIAGQGETFDKLFGDLVVDPAKAVRELGWTPAESLSGAIAEMTAAFRVK